MQNILKSMKSIFCNLFQPNLQEKRVLSGSWRETVEMSYLLYWEFPAVLSAQKYVHPATPTFETVLSGKYPSLHNISAAETLFSVLSKSMLFLFSLCCLGKRATRCHCFSCCSRVAGQPPTSAVPTRAGSFLCLDNFVSSTTAMDWSLCY